MKAARQTARQAGFTLFEVLVAVLVMGTGTLGFAAVQALTINNTAVARYQGLAALEVSSLSALMASNHAYWGALAASGTVCITVNTAASPAAAVVQELAATASCDPTATSGSGPLNATTTDCVASACSAVQIAAYDLKRWATELNAPGHFAQPAARIACSVVSSAPTNCVVDLSWAENNVALNDQQAASSGLLADGHAARRDYSQLVQP